MDELGLLFKDLPEKVLLKVLEDVKGVKSLKNVLQPAFVVAADGSKISEHNVIWKSKSPRCFKNIEFKTRPSMVHNFSNEKVWMRTEIMEETY